MKTNLEDNIWIEGFATQTGVDLELLSNNKSFLRDDVFGEFNSNLLYEGKTSEIPEELAKKCIKWIRTSNGDLFHNYRNGTEWCSTSLSSTAKESIQSACDKKYCVIYKTN